jgi:hypothetical protein
MDRREAIKALAAMPLVAASAVAIAYSPQNRHFAKTYGGLPRDAEPGDVGYVYSSQSPKAALFKRTSVGGAPISWEPAG